MWYTKCYVCLPSKSSQHNYQESHFIEEKTRSIAKCFFAVVYCDIFIKTSWKEVFVLIAFIIHNVNSSLFFYDHHYSVIFEHPTFLDRGNSLEQTNVISCFLVGVQCMIFSLVTQENLGKKSACSKEDLYQIYRFSCSTTALRKTGRIRLLLIWTTCRFRWQCCPAAPRTESNVNLVHLNDESEC